MMVLQQSPVDDKRSLLARDQYQYELSEIERLDVLEERRLADLARSGNEEAKAQLIENCLPCVLAYARKYARMNRETDALDLVQVGSEAMVRHVSEALKARSVRAFLLAVARFTIVNYCIEDRLIRVPRTSFNRGRRAPLTVSLYRPTNDNTTVLDLIEA